MFRKLGNGKEGFIKNECNIFLTVGTFSFGSASRKLLSIDRSSWNDKITRERKYLLGLKDIQKSAIKIFI